MKTKKRTIEIYKEQGAVPRDFTYTLFWMFICGSVAGFISETIYCLLFDGHLSSRSSFVFGPFTLVYGVGAGAYACCIPSSGD